MLVARVLPIVMLATAAVGCSAVAGGSDVAPDGQGANIAQHSEPTSNGARSQPQAIRALMRATRSLMEASTGQLSSELRIGHYRHRVTGQYDIRAERASLGVFVSGSIQAETTETLPVLITLNGKEAYLSNATQTQWFRVPKSKLVFDLLQWPTGLRHLPDRAIALVGSARAVGFDSDDPSAVVATVPGRMLAGLFTQPEVRSVAFALRNVRVPMNFVMFDGRLTSMTLEGHAVSDALRKAGVSLDPNVGELLKGTSYTASVSGQGTTQQIVMPPKKRIVDLPERG